MNILTESPKQNQPEDQKSTGKHHWCLLRNVVRAVTLFKNYDAHHAELNELISDIKKIPTDKQYRESRLISRQHSAYHVALQDLRREQSLLQCVERGNPDDLIQIKLEIEQDPYKRIRNNTHPLALINKRNANGQTPMYIACKNGNLEVVLLLLEENADYLIGSVIDLEEETNLEVAVRWGHKKIVEVLLKLPWPKQILEKARSLCRGPDMLGLFKKSSKRRWTWCCLKNSS